MLRLTVYGLSFLLRTHTRVPLHPVFVGDIVLWYPVVHWLDNVEGMDVGVLDLSSVLEVSQDIGKVRFEDAGWSGTHKIG